MLLAACERCVSSLSDELSHRFFALASERASGERCGMSTDFMRRYRVEHHTIYSYSEVVTLSHQQLHLTPRHLDYQRVAPMRLSSCRRRPIGAKASILSAIRLPR